MTWNEIRQKYGEFADPSFTRQDMCPEREREFVNDCFDAYESGGFADVFQSCWAEKVYNGMKFEVVGRIPEYNGGNQYGADLECLPMWKIRLENGELLDAYPEEICLDEINKKWEGAWG